MIPALEQYRRKRHEDMTASVTRALRELDEAGAPINFSSVASSAGVSRQWLYDSPFRAEIQALRTRSSFPGGPKAHSVREAASEASRRTQNHALRQRLKELRDENRALRKDLERALGGLRR
ncbi:MAG: transposase [Propionibacterium sp.]|nr:transposase [Propionibacterium sp.]